MALWRAGLFQGDPSGRFLPDENATRAQVAALCMRLDTHLVDSGIKTYIEEEDSKKPEKPSGGSTGGSGSGSHDDPDEPDEPDDPAGEPMELYYEPEAEHTPLTAAAEGVAEDFSLTVICTDEERMTAAEVEKRISAEDQNDLTGGQVIQVTAGAGDGEFIVTGMYIGLDGETPVQGFRPGGAYRIVLEDDALAFAGCEPSVREYHFTVAREEKDGLELNPNMIYLPAESISQITENGQAVAQINTALLTMTVGDEPVQEGAEMISGSFVSEKELNIGDTVAVYQGLHPDKRTVDAEGADKTADIAYVNITGRTGNKYDYESAQVEDVVFIPDMLPVSIYEDTDGNPDNHSITVPVDSMTYAEPVYAQLGLNGEVTVEEGDYLFFYEGVLEEAMATARSDEENGENGEAGEQIVDHGYGKITSLTLDEESGSCVIEYEPTTREEIAEELSAYDEEPSTPPRCSARRICKTWSGASPRRPWTAALPRTPPTALWPWPSGGRAWRPSSGPAGRAPSGCPACSRRCRSRCPLPPPPTRGEAPPAAPRRRSKISSPSPPWIRRCSISRGRASGWI